MPTMFKHYTMYFIHFFLEKWSKARTLVSISVIHRKIINHSKTQWLVISLNSEGWEGGSGSCIDRRSLRRLNSSDSLTGAGGSKRVLFICTELVLAVS